MIEIQNVRKRFDNITALGGINTSIAENQVFGLVGTNGAGKSTLLRTICGVYKPDEGQVLIDGEPVYENPAAKSKVFFISDDQFYFAGGTALDMVRYYETMYPKFTRERFLSLMEALKLDPKRKLNTFSKGMKKQVSVLLGVSAGTKYLLCDETFDGLDPVIRQAIKRLFIKEMDEHQMTPIIASHNLRELEDICEHVGLLHKGGILLNEDLEDMKLGMYKLQVVFQKPEDLDSLLGSFELVSKEQRGSLYTLTLRGQRAQIESAIGVLSPVFFEILPLTLEEIFISETEVLGYDFKNLTE